MDKNDVKNSSSIQSDIRHWVRKIENGADVKDVLEEAYAIAYNSGKSYGAYYSELIR